MHMIDIDQKWFKDVDTLHGIKSWFSWTFGGAGVIYACQFWSLVERKKFVVAQDPWKEDVSEWEDEMPVEYF